MVNRQFVNITGVSEGGVAAVVSKLQIAANCPLIVVTEDSGKARRLAMDFEFFSSRKGHTYILDENTDAFFNYQAKNKENSNNLISALCGLIFEEGSTVFLPASMLLKKLPSVDELKTHFFTFEIGETVDLEKLKKDLVDSGYERAQMVEACGQFSVRASILDIFAPNLDNPIRIELFDTDIEAIKFFDVESQRTIKKIQKINIMPASIIFGSDENFNSAAANLEKAYEKVIKRLSKKAENETVCQELSKQKICLLKRSACRKIFNLLKAILNIFIKVPQTYGIISKIEEFA